MKHLSLKMIAVFKAVRGCIALSLATGFWFGSHQSNLEFNDWPDWLRRITNDQWFELAILFLTLSIIRWVEALGIWFNQAWAQWLAVMTGTVGAIFFAFKLWSQFEWITLAILSVNLGIVFYLVWLLKFQKPRSYLFIAE